MHHLSNRVMEISEELRTRILEYYPYDFRQGFGPLIGGAIRSGQIDSRYSEGFVAKVLEILLMNAHRFLALETDMDGFVGMIDRIIDFMQYGMAAKKEGD
jgi:predicted nuclease with RNAse H fold